jgi:hypothetical protein
VIDPRSIKACLVEGCPKQDGVLYNSRSAGERPAGCLHVYDLEQSGGESHRLGCHTEGCCRVAHPQ